MSLSFIKTTSGGGGILHDRDAEITDYEIVVRREGPGWTALNCNVTFKEDGRDEPTVQFMDVGFLPDEATLSKDGKKVSKPLAMRPNKKGLLPDFAVFLSTLCEPTEGGDGFPAAALEAEGGKSFKSLIGTRVHLVRERDELKTEVMGKRVVEIDGEQREFDRETLKVARVLTVPKKAQAASGGADITSDSAAEALREILKSQKDKKVNVEHLKAYVTSWAISKGNSPDKIGPLTAQISNEQFLQREDGWSYDQATGTVAIPF